MREGGCCTIIGGPQFFVIFFPLRIPPDSHSKNLRMIPNDIRRERKKNNHYKISRALTITEAYNSRVGGGGGLDVETKNSLECNFEAISHLHEENLCFLQPL